MYNPDNNPSISVIVPFYNSQTTLSRCVRSILGQSYRNIEIILLDDASGDDSLRIARGLERMDDRIRLHSLPHGGEAAARNRGIELSKGDYIAFVDADDYVERDYIKDMLSAAEKGRCEMAACSYYVRGIRGSIRRTVRLSDDGPRVIESPGELHRFYLTRGAGSSFAWGKLYRRTVFEGVKYPEGRAYPDIAVLPHIIEAAGRCAFTDRPLYHYCLNANGITAAAPVRMQFHGLRGRLDNIRFYMVNYPDLTGPARERAIDYGCYLMGKISRDSDLSALEKTLIKLSSRIFSLSSYRVSLPYRVLCLLVIHFPKVMSRLFALYSKIV